MRYFGILCLLLVLGTAPGRLPAQCAMCKANLESATSDPRNTNGVGRGINNGILYLLAMPYLAAVLVGIAWYRQRRRMERLSTKT